MLCCRQKHIENKSEASVTSVPYFRLFRFLTRNDRICLSIGMFSTLIASCCPPLLNVLFGEMAELVVDAERNFSKCNATYTNSTHHMHHSKKKILDEMTQFTTYMILVGCAQLISGYFFVSIFSRLAEIQTYRLRQEYFKALLRQNICWYDTIEDRNFVASVSENVAKFQEAIGEKAGMFLYYITSSIICLAVAFYNGWLLTFVLLSTAPIMALVIVGSSCLETLLSTREQNAYSKAGVRAQEALLNIKTVMAFSGQQKEIESFEYRLDPALRAGRLRGIVGAWAEGLLWLLSYANYALGLWYGTKLIFNGRQASCSKSGPQNGYETAEFLVVFFNVLSCSFDLGEALPYLEVFSIGRAAAASIYNVIDRTPEIDSYSEDGTILNTRLRGKIEFQNVYFTYPSRRDVKVLKSMNFVIHPQMIVAFVGSSGCGKSTCLQLLQRFYDADKGKVLIDDMDVKDLNIHWYRSALGVVSQEPTLFNTTIAENIRYGKMDATQLEIEEACKLSNAHEFISRLPHKYETIVGEGGAQLSGGQKQRIAIARALVRNPSILILDEATSALDSRSEAIVQEAINRASEGRTTLIVAHRLSTVRNADVIVVIKHGRVAEYGSHDELMGDGGIYYKLIRSQLIEDMENDADENADSFHEEQTSGGSGSIESHALGSVKTDAGRAETVRAIGGIAFAKPFLETALARRTSFFSLMRLNAPEWPWIASGCLISVLQGSILPLEAFIFSQFTEVLSQDNTNKAQAAANKFARYFVYLGICSGLVFGMGLTCFTVAGEALTNRLRKLSFRAIMKQDLAWFDQADNAVGGLCMRLSGDAATVQGATGSRLGITAQSVTTIVIAAAFGLAALPKLGAVGFAFVPVIVLATYYNGRLIENQQMEEKAAVEEASEYAFQAVNGIRTVACLGIEMTFVEMYSTALWPSHRKAVRYSHFLGLVFGVSQGLLFFAYAAVYYYGSYLIQEEGVGYTKVLLIGEAMVWTMMELGQMLSYAPNYNKAKVAGGRILNLLSNVTEKESSKGLKVWDCQGEITFDRVEFHYPTRSTRVLKGLSFEIQANQNVGICGPSGSGKSTCIHLILRYYDPNYGEVMLDDMDISALNLDDLRSKLAIVSQEPSLFDRTLAENIAYGDNFRELSMKEIVEAAKSANIHEFILTLPNGYSTKVGDMGAQLSGGQKQRVAIARALVRNPKILLLDEATSALDAESEIVVQGALDYASQGRTTITIAHRLSTIQHADLILVINNGRLSESGKHDDLMKLRGLYYRLWVIQNHQS